MIGGLGSGKSRSGAEAFVDLVLANPGCETMMAGPTHEMTRDICVPAFEAAMPADMIVGYNKSEKVFMLRGGRRVKHASADKPSSLEGRNVAAFWADEARYWPHESWRNLLARLRESRSRLLQGIVTTTPAMNWLAEEFNSGRDDRVVYRASTAENEHNLAPGYIADLRRSYSARLCQSLIEGDFAVVAGQVYEEFDAARHAVAWEYTPSLPLWLSWDFGVRESSILMAQTTGDFPHRLADGTTIPPRSVVIFDELQLSQLPTAHQIPAVLRRLNGRRLHAIVCDPAGNQRDQATGIPSVALLQDAFGHIVQWSTAVVDRHIPARIQRVCGALAPVEGPPRLYVSRELVGGHHRGVVAALRGHVYPETKGGRASDLPLVDKYEHACMAGGTPVLTPNGYRPIESISAGDNVVAFDRSASAFVVKAVTAAGCTGRGSSLLRVTVRVGNSIRGVVATGDHPFLTVGNTMKPASELAPGDRLRSRDESDCDRREDADVRREAVQEARGAAVLRQNGHGEGRHTEGPVPAPRGLDAGERPHPGQVAHPPPERRPVGQQAGESGGHLTAGSRGGALDPGEGRAVEAQRTGCDCCGSRVAQVGRGPCVALGEQQALHGKEAAGRCDVPAVQQVLPYDVPDARQVLPPELPGDVFSAGERVDSRDAGVSEGGPDVRGVRQDVRRVGLASSVGVLSEVLGEAEVVAVESAGTGDVWNLTVADAHTFVADGIVVSNCDTLEYLVVATQNQHRQGAATGGLRAAHR